MLNLVDVAVQKVVFSAASERAESPAASWLSNSEAEPGRGWDGNGGGGLPLSLALESRVQFLLDFSLQGGALYL